MSHQQDFELKAGITWNPSQETVIETVPVNLTRQLAVTLVNSAIWLGILQKILAHAAARVMKHC